MLSMEEGWILDDPSISFPTKMLKTRNVEMFAYTNVVSCYGDEFVEETNFTIWEM